MKRYGFVCVCVCVCVCVHACVWKGDGRERRVCLIYCSSFDDLAVLLYIWISSDIEEMN